MFNLKSLLAVPGSHYKQARKILISSLLLTSMLAQAQSSSNIVADTIIVNNNKKIAEIIVSAQRNPTAYSKVARVVTVISREDIRLSPVQSLQDLLEYVANVDVRQRGAHGVQADISIRGGSFDQTMILLNGVNITDPQTGHLSLDLPVSIEDIDRVEILQGAGSRVFGPNAFSGAINFVTSNEKNNTVKVKLSAGEHGLRSSNLGASITTDNLNSYMAFSRKSSDGYMKNTDFKNSNLFYQGKLNTKSGVLDLQLGHNEKDFGANGFYSPRFPNQFEATKTTFSSLRFTSNGEVKFTPLVYWRQHKDRFELFRENPASWYKTHNYHLTDVFGSSLNISFASKFGKTSTGVEYRVENIFSNVLGLDLAKKRKVPSENGKYFTKQDRRDNISYFLEHNVYIDKFTVSAGLLANWNSALEKKINLYPGIDLSYQLSDYIKYYCSFNKSLRMPTFTELYYVGPSNIGNINLKPEKSTSYEMGFKINKDWIQSSLSVFMRQGKDILDWVKNSVDDKWQAQNITELNTTGFELSSNINTMTILGDNFPVNNINISYMYLHMSKKDSKLISNYALDQLKHKFNISLNHKIYKSLAINWKASWQERNGSFILYSKDKNINGKQTNYKPFWTLDTKLYWQAHKYNIFVDVSNILDYEYFDLGNLPQSGRWIRAGVEFTIQ